MDGGIDEGAEEMSDSQDRGVAVQFDAEGGSNVNGNIDSDWYGRKTMRCVIEAWSISIGRGQLGSL